MARNRVIPNFLYGTLGLAVVGVGTFFAVRAVRRRRHASGDDPMLGLRRSTRKIGRSVKDTGEQLGKDIRRGVEDTGEALAEAGNEFASPTTSYNRI